jgi:hypothetical protein
MGWGPAFAAQIVKQAERRGTILRENERLVLTEPGRQRASETIVNSAAGTRKVSFGRHLTMRQKSVII